MNGVRQRFLGLCLPPMAFCLLDCALTLAGQSAAYWGGAYRPAQRGVADIQPPAGHAPAGVRRGDPGMDGGICRHTAAVARHARLIVCIVVTLGHTAGAATWVLFRFQYGYQACNGLFLLAAAALGIGVRWGWQAAPRQEYRLPFLTGAWRWALAAVLFGVGVYLFLWPRSV
jgi:hypothetical protein